MKPDHSAALNHPCPQCGQPPGSKCRNARRDWLDRRTLYNYCNPHPERAELAWRAARGLPLTGTNWGTP